MAVKQAGKKAAQKSATKASKMSSSSSAKKTPLKQKESPIQLEKNTSAIAGWLQDLSLEAPVAVGDLSFKPGEREVEFSVAVRQRQEGAQTLAELRGRALVHAQGYVLALAEASYIAVKPKDMEEEALVKQMYLQLRPSLQQALAMAGHTPPLPETLESSAEK